LESNNHDHRLQDTAKPAKVYILKGELLLNTFVFFQIATKVLSFDNFNNGNGSNQYKTIALTRASNKAQERVAVTSGTAAPVSTYQNNLATVERLLTMAATFYDGYTHPTFPAYHSHQ
jgi:hypothetical protein